MDSPLWRPPTDNLYKFLALSGLVAMLVALIYPLTMINKLEIESAEVFGDLKLSQAELARLELRVAALRAEDSSGQIEAGHRYLAETQLDEFSDALFDAQKAMILSQTRSHKLDVLFDNTKKWVNLAIILFAVGTVAMTFGFWKWYTKIQRFEDAILERRAA
jgi:hypothetical protein